MTAVNDIWRGMVARRLWPVALLLLLALAAVPFLLAKDPEVAPVTSPIASAATTNGGALDAKPVVAVASDASRADGRVVLGSRKDPFRPAIKARKGKAVKPAAAASAPSAASPSTPSGGGGSTPSGSTPVITPGGVGITPVKHKTYELFSIAVRFGESSADTLKVRNVRRLKALPSVSEPLLVYLGVLSNGKTAVFMVDSSVVAQGDGRCQPSPQNCQTLHLNPGETEFLDVSSEDGNSVAQYQLDLVKIRKTRTTNASAAKKALTATASGGRAALRPNLGRVGRYRYNPKTGTLRKIGLKAWRAAAAKAAKAAAASAQ